MKISGIEIKLNMFLEFVMKSEILADNLSNCRTSISREQNEKFRKKTPIKHFFIDPQKVDVYKQFIQF